MFGFIKFLVCFKDIKIIDHFASIVHCTHTAKRTFLIEYQDMTVNSGSKGQGHKNTSRDRAWVLKGYLEHMKHKHLNQKHYKQNVHYKRKKSPCTRDKQKQ